MPSNKSYSCTRCRRRYADKNELLLHKKREHGRVTQGRARYETVEDDICAYCHTRFAGINGVDKHLQSSAKCGPIHAKWQSELPSALSSAAPSTRSSSSDSRSRNSDAFDKSDALDLSDDESQSAHSSSSERISMDIDAPIHSHEGTDPSSSPEDVNLLKMVDTGGNVVYVEYHPKAHAGQPIRRANESDLPESSRSYPDVGPLSDPEAFEIAQILMQSGVSGRFRNRYLTLKRVSNIHTRIQKNSAFTYLFGV